MTFKSGEEGQPLVQHHAHDMAVTRRPEQLQGQERSQGGSRVGSSPIRGTPLSRRMRSRGIAASIGRKRNRPPNLVRNDRGLRSSCRTSATSAVVGRDSGWAFIVSPAWQPSEPFILENLCDGDRAEGVSLVGQVTADVVDGEVLLPQGDDAVAEGIGLGCGLRSLGRREEEIAVGDSGGIVDEDTEATWGVTEAASDLGAGNLVDEEGSQGLVLAMGGVGGFEEDAGEVR